MLTKKSAFKESLKNELGFTYVSMLLALTIIAITLPFFGYLLQITNQLNSSYDELSAQQFFQFLRDEVISSEDLIIENNRIILIQGDFEVTIEQYGNLIRRQVSRQGHEILLRDVKDLIIDPNPYGIKITINSIEGETYGKTIVFYQ